MFTFGHGQPNANHHVFVEAVDEMTARTAMCAVYGSRWSFCYPPDDQAWVDDPAMASTEMEFGAGITKDEP